MPGPEIPCRCGRPGGRRLLRMDDRHATRDPGRTWSRRSVRRLHRLLHVVPVRPHRARRDRHALPHTCGVAVPGAPAARRPRRSSATTSVGTARCSIDNRCSIYEHRPRTCRTYDCRVFPGRRLDDDDDDKAPIADGYGAGGSASPPKPIRMRTHVFCRQPQLAAARCATPPSARSARWRQRLTARRVGKNPGMPSKRRTSRTRSSTKP